MRHLGDITKINGAEIEPVYETTSGTICCGVIAFIGLVCLHLATDGRKGKRK